MNPQEAQRLQSQTIAGLKERRKAHFANRMEMHGLMRFVDSLHADYITALKIVDSQAQKIAQLTKERDAMTATAYRLGSESQQYISEARAEAEKWRRSKKAWEKL